MIESRQTDTLLIQLKTFWIHTTGRLVFDDPGIPGISTSCSTSMLARILLGAFISLSRLLPSSRSF